MFTFKIICATVIFIITIFSGIYPFFSKLKNKTFLAMPRAEALSVGVFLGAGLIHMLGESSAHFLALDIEYPIAFLIAGSVFLLFLLLEHVAKEIYQHGNKSSIAFAYVATFMMSIHGFLAGAALGLTDSLSLAFIVLFAIMAHKWAESFALALHISKSALPFSYAITLFLIFSLMTPLGIFAGSYTTNFISDYATIEATFLALAAGTFLYFGSLHGLEKSVLITECCNLSVFLYVILGFALMAVIAVWA